MSESNHLSSTESVKVSAPTTGQNKTINQPPDTARIPLKNTSAVLRWIAAFLKPYRYKVIAALVCLLIGSLTWLSLGQGVRLLVDEGFTQGASQQLNRIMLALLAIITISSIAVFCRFYLMSWLGERVSNDIRCLVYQRLLSLPPAFFAKARTGEVISRFTADTTLIQTVIGSSFSMALRSSVTVMGGIIMMAFTSWQLTGLVLLAVPIVLGPIVLLGQRVRNLSRTSQDKVADLGAYIDETLHEIHTVQAYGHEAIDKAHFTGQTQAIMQAASARIKYRAFLIAIVLFLSIAAIVSVTWFGAFQVMNGAISGGDLSAFLFYAVMVAAAMATISEVFSDIQHAAGAAERLIELAHTQSELVERAQPQALPANTPLDIGFDNVTFSYPGQANNQVFNQLSLTIKAGKRIALVGPSGAGKSSLFSLLQRFYDIQQGSITLAGIPIDALSLSTLRQQFALVPQDPVIFATSVLENVRYGRPDATEDDVIHACIAARVDEFIDEFNEGYQTYLGERGIRLSGGQKQRIAIARALLADRPILLLDEATSALDAISEIKVKQALDELMLDKTSIIIAHRLSTVINADCIIVLEQGHIVASGTHHELMQSSPLYHDFASLQLLDEQHPDYQAAAGLASARQ
ncbi:ABC transporter transmembrane domain-containing protein [Shewanella sp. NIFS-20-20]|uniref:ABC transporter transmembrane domain-containing protein n=1 Tax=Shewanella sp. NIFS-20-20 TaxID=2853806 RepID=UPI001C448485|nr:ABC transporter transmembrane domain-containing protein [Shewanella sp. NIFS-20-20]MBV7315824.1 ATP-binding cassette domain-containing protein [Shewanella sp. NIFS-20-20]